MRPRYDNKSMASTHSHIIAIEKALQACIDRLAQADSIGRTVGTTLTAVMGPASVALKDRSEVVSVEGLEGLLAEDTDLSAIITACKDIGDMAIRRRLQSKEVHYSRVSQGGGVQTCTGF